AERPEALPAGAAQVEVLERHRDGSIRTARLVAAPRLAPGERLALRLAPVRATPESDGAPDVERLETAAVRARLLPHRAGALAARAFPALAPAPLVGTIAHGTFADVALSPDFYSGHAVAITEPGEKVTDLQPLARARRLASGPLRDVLAL